MSEARSKPHHHSYEEKCLIVRYALEHRDISLDAVAATTEVARSTLYRWLHRIGWDPANLEALRHGGCGRRRGPDQQVLAEGLQQEIRAVLNEHPGWGPLKIKHYFWRHRQLAVSQRRIYRFLKEEGVIEARRRTPCPGNAGGKGERRFEASHPLELVQMDCLGLTLTGGQALWLVSMLDDCSRFILHSRLVPVKTMESIIEVFREGVRQWGLMNKLLTDQGSEFVSWHGFTRFEELLVNLDVELILSAAHHPETLGKLERWHETFREALREHGPVDYGSQGQLLVRDFVAFYNYERPHEALNGLVPADRFFGVSEALETELNASREGRGENRQLYLCCQLGGKRIVLSGPRLDAVDLYVDGKPLSWEEPAIAVAPRVPEEQMEAASPAQRVASSPDDVPVATAAEEFQMEEEGSCGCDRSMALPLTPGDVGPTSDAATLPEPE
ncbi:DDE-type integrase/transposase/recombinase [PVC group bacterium]|nr:DDE-type integrase/transposase/recombinase [PVC group bacterium]